MADYNRFIEINPDRADVYYNRGIIYHEQEKNNLAEIDLERSKKLYSRQGDVNSVDQVNDVLDHVTSG